MTKAKPTKPSKLDHKASPVTSGGQPQAPERPEPVAEAPPPPEPPSASPEPSQPAAKSPLGRTSDGGFIAGGRLVDAAPNRADDPPSPPPPASSVPPEALADASADDLTPAEADFKSLIRRLEHAAVHSHGTSGDRELLAEAAASLRALIGWMAS